MDKITRILLLYSYLIQGKKINKLLFCMDTEINSRTFDRDIEDIRLYLSDNFTNQEIIYDRLNKVYYMTNIQGEMLEEVEYLFLQRLLLDTRILRTDELDIMLNRIAKNTENSKNLIENKNLLIKKYSPPIHKKALIKMQKDLFNAIRDKLVITINYLKSNQEYVKRKILPCELKYDSGHIYLIAFLQEKNKKYPAYFRIDKIYSFEILGKQSIKEIKKVNNYLEFYSNSVIQMYGGELINVEMYCNKYYYQHIYDKFKDIQIIKENNDRIYFKIQVFEDGFIKWFVSQDTNHLKIISPQNLIQNILNYTNKIIKNIEEV